MKLPDSVRELIESGAHAHLVTLNPGGSPQVTIVWAGIDGEDIVTAHLYESKKVRNIRQDGRVAVTFESDSKSDMGLVEYLTLSDLASRAYHEIAIVHCHRNMEDNSSAYFTQSRVCCGGVPKSRARLAKIDGRCRPAH